MNVLHGIYWLGHASFRIEEGMVLYLDPWKLASPIPADYILITHGHHDHLSTQDVAKLARADTVVVCPATCAQELSNVVAAKQIKTIAPGDALQLGAAKVEAVPSYNTNKPNHPKSAGNLGFIIELAGRRIYHAGDTDLIPEMADIRCDVALLPIGGTYTMNAAEAVQAAERIRPQVVVPMHWGDIVGAQRDVDYLVKHAPKGVQIIALDAER